MLPKKSGRWVLALLAVAACDLRNPASTSVTSVPAPMPEDVPHAEAVLLGTYSAPNAMPEPGQITSRVPLQSTGIRLPPNTYTLLRVTGTLTILENPYLPGSTPGQVVASYTPVESGQSTGRGNTNVWLHRSKAARTDRISYYFRPDVGGRDQILLVRTGQESLEVWSEREMMPGSSKAFGYCLAGFPYCEAEHVVQPDSSALKKYVWIEDFWIVESHVVTAAQVPEPLTVEGPEAVAPGGTATYTAQPWGGMRLRDLNGIPADVRWVWYAKDTTGTPSPNIDGKIVCSGQMPSSTCAFEPKESGRLHVVSHVEGAVVEANKVVRVQQQTLQLTCPASVQRAATMHCTVAAVPAGTLDSVQWAFVDSAGNTVRDSTGRLSWGGRMVVGGRISVSAKLNGLSVTKDTLVIVTPRSWASPVPTRREFFMRCQTLSSTCFQLYPPTFQRHLGSHVFNPRGIRLQDRAASVIDGPNAGWSYLSGTDSPVRFNEHLIVLNDILKPDNNELVAQEFWSERSQCDRAEVLDDVRTHERHHANLFDQRRHIVNAEVEREVAFVSAYEWRTMLLSDGEVAARVARRIHEISGGTHQPEDGFEAESCDLELFNNP